MPHRLGDGTLERWIATHIKLDRVRLRDNAVEALRQLPRRVDLTVCDPNLSALRDHLGTQRGTDAGRGAGHESDSA